MATWVDIALADRASRLYDLARKRAEHGGLWAMVGVRARGLHPLGQVKKACIVQAEAFGEILTVPICQIKGSEGRSQYFDQNFDPLHDQARDRWLSIARARRQGRALPPVSLVQVRDVYYVRDGHHRISVARALGQTTIEAKVTAWNVYASQTCEIALAHGRPGYRDERLGRAIAFLQRLGSRLLHGSVATTRVALDRAGFSATSHLLPRACLDGRVGPAPISSSPNEARNL